MKSPNRHLKIFRMENGQRVPYIIELDANATVVAEYVDKPPEKPTHEQQLPAMKKPARNIDEQKLLLVSQWVVASIQNNPLPGTDELRAEYFKTKAELEEKFKAKGEKCPGCVLGDLIRTYRAKLEKGGFLNI